MMRRILILAVVLACSSGAAHAGATPAKENGPKKVTISQLEETVTSARGLSDEVLRERLSGMVLVERLSPARLAQLIALTSGDKTREALQSLADASVFEEPPDNEIPADASPDAAATRQMLVRVVGYVNTDMRQLPNLIATRKTTSFEDRPPEDRLEATGIVSYSAMPLHVVGRSTATVTYRDHRELVSAGAPNPKQGAKTGGLVTEGEYGPILAAVVGDALRGKITWARWEQGENGTVGVFHYTVAGDKSNYHVRFCCVVDGYASNGQPEMKVFDERVSYGGEIAFQPANGAVIRLTVQADMAPQGLVSGAGIAVEYGPVEIGGKSSVCPLKSISLLKVFTAKPEGAFSQSHYQGTPKTFLNDVEFADYHRFGSEARILAGDATGGPRLW
jgi:hypothetical protein